MSYKLRNNYDKDARDKSVYGAESRQIFEAEVTVPEMKNIDHGNLG